RGVAVAGQLQPELEERAVGDHVVVGEQVGDVVGGGALGNGDRHGPGALPRVEGRGLEEGDQEPGEERADQDQAEGEDPPAAEVAARPRRRRLAVVTTTAEALPKGVAARARALASGGTLGTLRGCLVGWRWRGGRLRLPAGARGAPRLGRCGFELGLLGALPAAAAAEQAPDPTARAVGAL